MPILTRPVREQLDHDRVIRLLQARYKRKTEVIINPGSEQNQSVTVGALAVFPDVLIFAEGGRKLLATVEVETGESVNQLEALAEWNVFSKLRVPLHLYVPTASVDTARRLYGELNIPVAELWAFHPSFDQVRFTLIHRVAEMALPKPKDSPKPAPKVTAVAKKAPVPSTPQVSKSKGKPAAKPTPKPAPKVVAKAKAKTQAAKPAARKPAAAKPAKPVKKSAANSRR